MNLIVSQVNGCNYCLSAHTVFGEINGFTDEQILELRQGYFSTNEKFDALVKVAKAITINKGKFDDTILEDFFNVGYSKETLVDVILAVGDKVVMNYLHNLTQIDIDFPVAQELELIKS